MQIVQLQQKPLPRAVCGNSQRGAGGAFSCNMATHTANRGGFDVNYNKLGAIIVQLFSLKCTAAEKTPAAPEVELL